MNACSSSFRRAGCLACVVLPLLAQADDEPAGATQPMAWARAPKLSFGVGVEQHSLLVGVSLAATPRTSVALQAPLARDDRERAAADAPRMALRSRDTLGELRAGLQLKMQLQEQTTLAIRPRKGGFGVTLRSQW